MKNKKNAVTRSGVSKKAKRSRKSQGWVASLFLRKLESCESIDDVRKVHAVAETEEERELAWHVWRTVVNDSLRQLFRFDTTDAPEWWGLKKPEIRSFVVRMPDGSVEIGFGSAISWTHAEVKRENRKRAKIAKMLWKVAPPGSKEKEAAKYMREFFIRLARSRP